MIDSILTSVKKDLGITEDYTHFDDDIIAAINGSFAVLTQMGAGPVEGFAITDSSSVWSDFTTEVLTQSLVRSYVPKKVKLMFDPPTSSGAIDALKQVIAELEWRINSSVDFKKD